MMQQPLIQTFTGLGFNPLAPDPALIRIEDVAHSLSMICRFGGHCTRFYSVAEHSWHVSRLVPRVHALWGLLHDAAEAYCGDVLSPLKPYWSQHRDTESRLTAAIALKFGLRLPIPATVHEADMAMLAAEREQVMVSAPSVPWSKTGTPAPVDLECLSPPVARSRFLKQFHALRHGF